jgi:Protein of unknown function (DUF2550)
VLRATLAVLAVIWVVVTAALLVIVLRRRFLQRQLGSFDCSVRLDWREPGKGWTFGVARYTGDRIEWFRAFSLSPRPRHVFVRRDLQVRGRRVPEGAEAYAVLANALVLECGLRGRPLELAMSAEAVMGFMSWLEAAPPGQHLVA